MDEAFQYLVSFEKPLPRPLLVPWPDHPFVYFHLRKAGGTSMRTDVAVSARNAQVGFYVPCEGDERVPSKLNAVMATMPRPRGTSWQHTWDSCRSHSRSISILAAHEIAANVSVFAGIFTYDTFVQDLATLRFWPRITPSDWMNEDKKLPRWSQEDHYDPAAADSDAHPLTSRRVPMTCLVLVREPITRFLSCYGHYWQDTVIRRPFHSLSLRAQ